jgi:hypothetical protein
MAYPLTFRVLRDYRDQPGGITVPVVLTMGKKSVKFFAKLDTGADVCIFKREHGEELGLDIEAGQPLQVSTAAGSFLAYGHEVSISALSFESDLTAYFAFAYSFPRNVLGLSGWIEKLRLGIVHYERALYASRYDDPD